MMRSFVAVLLAFGAMQASAADFSFSRPIKLTTEYNTAASVAIGDANGDGRKDLAYVRDGWSSGTENRLFVYLQRADGTFAAPLSIGLGMSYTVLPVAFVDLDKDGAQEIFAGSPNTHMLTVRVANGALALSTHPTAMGCKYIVTGDIDADGNEDVVCHDVGVDATIFFGNGAGGFRNTLEEQTPAGSWVDRWENKSLVLADVTGDGRKDLLLTSSIVSSFFVLENNGLGGFWPGAMVNPHPWTSTGAWPGAMQALDVDGDGVEEIVTASPENAPNSFLNIYKPSEAGFLELTSRLPIGNSTTALMVADLEGDGDKELVAAHYDFHSVSVLGADGGGMDHQSTYDFPGFGNVLETFAADRDPRVVLSSHAFALGDLDNDGCADLAGISYSGVTLLYGCEPSVRKAPVSDFDGDGMSDALFHYGTGLMRFWPWADYALGMTCPTGRMTCPPPINPALTAQAFGDFDGDGTTDVMWRNRKTGENLLQLALFYDYTLPTVSTPWSAMGAGDFDGDGSSDLLWRNAASGANTIWRSAFNTSQMAMPTVTNLDWKIVGVGDFDGDGISDVLWRNSRTGANTIWRSANNLTQTAMATVGNLAWRVVGTGDFNADGRDDIVWRNTGTGAGTIWLSGSNATQRTFATVTNRDWDVAAIGDYDGDGVADLLWRNRASGANTIWRGANNATQKAMSSLDTQMLLVYPRFN